MILTSPEMCLGHNRFHQVLSDPKISSHVAAVIIDEAHCIAQWGDNFQEDYSKLGKLRALVPSSIPFLVTSATLPPLVLAQVRTTVHIQTSNSYHVNMGIDWPNIAWECRQMKGTMSDLKSLHFVLLKSCGGEGKDADLLQTLVFGDDINELMVATKWLQCNVPEDM